MCRFGSSTDRKCQSHNPVWIFMFTFPLSPLFLLTHLFCCFSAKSSSVLPASLSFAVECAPQQYLMKVWLTSHCCVHVSVFLCFVCTQAASQDRLWWLIAGRKGADRNYPPTIWVGKCIYIYNKLYFYGPLIPKLTMCFDRQSKKAYCHRYLIRINAYNHNSRTKVKRELRMKEKNNWIKNKTKQHMPCGD